jgi:sugar/nucleoside kinase (ribokinase family)
VTGQEPTIDVIVVGDVMIDVGVDAGALAKGGDVHGDVHVMAGGAGANAAVWAAAEGARVQLYGRVGDDLAGRVVREALVERGVEPCLAVDPEARTGAMLILRQLGDRDMVADRGANARLSPSDLPPELRAGAVLVSGYLLFAPGSHDAGVAAMARARSPFVAVDAASWPLVRDFGVDRFFRDTSKATVLLANELEASMLKQAPSRARANFTTICVKLGPGGAEMQTTSGTFRARPSTFSTGDATGAGDAFDGVLLAALAGGEEPEAALARACEAGARCAAGPELWPER